MTLLREALMQSRGWCDLSGRLRHPSTPEATSCGSRIDRPLAALDERTQECETGRFDRPAQTQPLASYVASVKDQSSSDEAVRGF